jgi:hypothetical protein
LTPLEGTVETKPKATRSRKTATTADKPARAAKAPAKPRKTAAAASNGSQPPTHEQIAQRAHELYVRSGHQHGREQEFWLEAERQLQEETSELSV